MESYFLVLLVGILCGVVSCVLSSMLGTHIGKRRARKEMADELNTGDIITAASYKARDSGEFTVLMGDD